MSKQNKFAAMASLNKMHTDLKVLGDKKYIEDIEISNLIENPFQPRLEIDKDELNQLALSIQEEGLLQPILFTRMGHNGKQEDIIIAGHRRVAAHKLLGLKKIKAIFKPNVTKQELASHALTENLQRINLTHVELAIQYTRLLNSNVFASVEELAKSLGKDKYEIGRIIKLMTLDEDVFNDLLQTKSIKDIKKLDMLRQIDDKEIQKEIYFWIKEEEPQPTRKEIKEMISSLYEKSHKQDKKEYNFTNSKKGCIVKLPQLSQDKAKQLENFIKKLLGEING